MHSNSLMATKSMGAVFTSRVNLRTSGGEHSNPRKTASPSAVGIRGLTSVLSKASTPCQVMWLHATGVRAHSGCEHKHTEAYLL
jgi:hypothetical protein